MQDFNAIMVYYTCLSNIPKDSIAILRKGDIYKSNYFLQINSKESLKAIRLLVEKK